jgi:hypothetical protein
MSIGAPSGSRLALSEAREFFSRSIFSYAPMAKNVNDLQ